MASEERIQTLHPAGKQGTNMEKAKVEGDIFLRSGIDRRF